METVVVNGVKAKVARTLFARMRGLIGTKRPPPGEGLLILRCRAIHTFFMSFAIDADGVPSTIGGQSVLRDLLPSSVAVTASSGRLAAEKGNDAKLSIRRFSSTGLFNGSFAIFTQNGDRLRKITVPFTGALVDGVGYGSAVIGKTGSVKVSLTVAR